MKNTKLARLASALVLTLSSLLTLSIPLAHAITYTCVWTGATDLKFSTATNWTGCNSVAPQPGNIISFGQAPTSATVNLTNDLGISLGGVISTIVNNSSHSNLYHINTIALTSGASLDFAPASTCFPEFANISYGTVTAAGNLTVSPVSDLTNTALTVNGTLTLKNGNSLNPASGSTVTGQVVVDTPVSTTTATGCVGGVGGGGASSGSSFTGFTVNGLTVQNGASTNLANTTFPLTLGGGTGTASPLVYFYGSLDTNYNYVATTYTISGPITLTHDALFSAQDKTTVNVTGSISGAAFTLTNDPYATGALNLTPSSNDSKSTAGSQANAAKTTTVVNDQSSTSFGVVPNETLVVDGKVGFVSLLSGATLMGGGQIAGLYAAPGSIVAPGHSPGCISSTQGITLSGTYQVQVGGTDPCTGYDQLKVIGTVTLDSANSVLDVSLWNGFVPKVGQAYTIIDNDASDIVSGTFKGITEAGTYTNQGVTYSVTYKGGDGNDVVLTVTAVDASKLPKKPNTGLLLVAAHPMVSLGASVIAAGMLYGASRRVKTVRR